MNILSLLNEKAEKYPDKIAFVFRNPKTNDYDKISFRDLDQKSSKVAIYLSRNGFERGFKSLILIKPSIDFIILIYGMIKLGVVPIFPPNFNLKSRNGRKQFRAILGRARIDALIGSRKILLIGYFLGLRSISNNVIAMDKIKSHYLDSNNNSDFSIDFDVDWG